jgi:hypothetical protein
MIYQKRRERAQRKQDKLRKQNLVELPEACKLHTDGKGLWSNVAKEVTLTEAYAVIDRKSLEKDRDMYYGELRVHFDTSSWNVNAFGLIYTDNLFLKELKSLLALLGYDVSDLEYSEQGMQGYDYVSLDIGQCFISSVKPLKGKRNELI